MRQDVKVTFLELVKGQYAPNTGSYANEFKEHIRYCNVTDLKASRSIEIFGEYVDSAKVVRSTTPFSFSFNKLKIKDKYYVPQQKRYPNNRTSIIVKEVSSNGS